MGNYYHRENAHGCIYYLIMWPFSIIWGLVKYATFFILYIAFLLIFMSFYIPVAIIIEVIKRIFGISIDKNVNSGEEYEEICCSVLRKKGFYKVMTTPRTGDHGVDIIAYANGVKYAIQCKYYSGAVGNHAVQEVYSGCDYYGCDKAVVLTNSTFTNNAIDEAGVLGVELWEKNYIPYRPRVSFKSFWEKERELEEYDEIENLPIEYTEECKIKISAEKHINESVNMQVRNMTDSEIMNIIRCNNIELGALSCWFREVAEMFTSQKNASLGVLQRKLGLEFKEAASVIDELEKFQVIEKIEEHKPIKVKMTETDFEFLYKELSEFKKEEIRQREPVKKGMSKEEIYQYAKECEYLARKNDKELGPLT